MVNRDWGKEAVSSQQSQSPQHPRGACGRVLGLCAFLAVCLCVSPFPKESCLSCTQQGSVRLPEQVPRPSPEHDSLGSHRLPHPPATSPALFWSGCHRRREEPLSEPLRGPSYLPSTTARLPVSYPGWNAHLLALQRLVANPMGTCPPSLPPCIRSETQKDMDV